jgi:hypothetical protein
MWAFVQLTAIVTPKLQRSEYKEFEVQEDAAIENDQKVVRIESEGSSVDWRPASQLPYSP